ncbi:hypothetical protein J2T55_000805 [Methylohalomonas lacus]|uniref:Uncharacterized protein n=1 Tax=Methylohalomonas lacus TaxID=398773 RepID=A0AAE3L180_9GAMM|nr:hypothetical protein [Methylohalomonas lacus]MCS3902801.1 hypothetical protein [Methylohalomonas lacus]
MSKTEQCLMKLRHNGKVYNIGDPAPSASNADLEAWRAAGVIGHAADKPKAGQASDSAEDDSN